MQPKGLNCASVKGAAVSAASASPSGRAAAAVSCPSGVGEGGRGPSSGSQCNSVILADCTRLAVWVNISGVCGGEKGLGFGGEQRVERREAKAFRSSGVGSGYHNRDDSKELSSARGRSELLFRSAHDCTPTSCSRKAASAGGGRAMSSSMACFAGAGAGAKTKARHAVASCRHRRGVGGDKTSEVEKERTGIQQVP